MTRKKKTDEQNMEVLAGKVKGFFEIFDHAFLNDDFEEDMIKSADVLEEKISRNESAFAVIVAMGGSYNSELDRAKLDLMRALINLINTRKKVREICIESAATKEKHKAILKQIFGV